MTTSGIINLAITAVLLIWLLSRQRAVRPLKENSKLAYYLLIIGGVQSIIVFSNGSFPLTDILWLVLSLVIGVGLSFWRGHTVALWKDGDVVYRQGSWGTIALWIVGIAQHLLVDAVVSPGLGAETLNLYFGFVLLVQQYILVSRGRKMGHFAPRMPRI